MISSTKLNQLRSSISQLLQSSCKSVSETGELAALAGWVNENFLRQFQTLLNQQVVSGNHIHIKLAWIDKSPIATPTSGNQLDQNMELADVAIIRLHVNKGKLMHSGLMALIQAKTTTKNPPYTPSADNRKNTKKEYDFLNSWPPFTLRQWSGSTAGTLTYNINKGLSQSDVQQEISRRGWFCVAPHNPKMKENWHSPPWDTSPWWCTSATAEDCDVSLSEALLQCVLRNECVDWNGKKSNYIGAQFSILDDWHSDTTWSGLAHQIAAWALDSDLPPSLFGEGQSRLIQFLTSTPKFELSHFPELNLFNLNCAAQWLNITSEQEKGLDSKPFPVIFITHEE